MLLTFQSTTFCFIWVWQSDCQLGMNILSHEGTSKRGGRHEYQDKIWDKPWQAMAMMQLQPRQQIHCVKVTFLFLQCVYVHLCSCTICVCSCFWMCVFGKVREQSCLLWFKPLKYSHTSPISSMYTLATPYIVRGRCTVKSGVVFGELSPNAPIVLGQYSRNPSSLQISNTLWNPRILTSIAFSTFFSPVADSITAKWTTQSTPLFFTVERSLLRSHTSSWT